MTRPPRDGDDDDYEVGYCKPPKRTRFQPGRSGNPKGRPKGTKNLRNDLLEVLSERILVREGDKTRHVSKQRAMVMALMAQALKGDSRSTSLLMSKIEHHLEPSKAQEELEVATVEDLAARLDELIKREERDREPPIDGSGGAE